MKVSWKTDCVVMIIVSILCLDCGIQLVHSDPLSSSPTSQSDSNCPSLVNCTKTCLLGMKKSADGCTVCECKVKGIFQGDIMIDEKSYDDLLRLFGEEERSRISKRAAGNSALGLEWPKVGGKVVVPYVFDDIIERKLRKKIKNAMKSFEKSTCVRFRPRIEESDYILFERLSNTTCYSLAGKVGGNQTLNLGPECSTRGTILHELMHALGFYHEHSRPDRDDYVTILWDNINEGEKEQFMKIDNASLDSFNSRYDLRSIMHYDGLAFSKNGWPTILDKRTNLTVRANIWRLSNSDIFQINEKYKCITENKYCVDKFPRFCYHTGGKCRNKYFSRFCKRTCNLCYIRD